MDDINNKCEDQDFLLSQVVDDKAEDVDMEGLEKLDDDFEFEDFEQAYESDSEEEERKGLDYDFQEEDDDDENENRESLQAHTYDRSFVISGPVVKVYKPSEDQNSNTHSIVFDQKLK
jgi:hypothetical protein